MTETVKPYEVVSDDTTQTEYLVIEPEAARFCGFGTDTYKVPITVSNGNKIVDINGIIMTLGVAEEMLTAFHRIRKGEKWPHHQDY